MRLRDFFSIFLHRMSWMPDRLKPFSRAAAVIFLLAGFLFVGTVRLLAASSFSYDQLGRVTSANYGNGLCVAYAYDPNGNRTAITTVTTSAQTATWGTPAWGCFAWTP